MLGRKPRGWGWGGESSLFKVGIFAKHLLTPVGSGIQTYKYPPEIRNIRKGPCAGFTKATLIALGSRCPCQMVPRRPSFAWKRRVCPPPRRRHHRPCTGSSSFRSQTGSAVFHTQHDHVRNCSWALLFADRCFFFCRMIWYILYTFFVFLGMRKKLKCNMHGQS